MDTSTLKNGARGLSARDRVTSAGTETEAKAKAASNRDTVEPNARRQSNSSRKKSVHHVEVYFVNTIEQLDTRQIA